MKTKIIFCILFIITMSTIYSQRPIKIEVSNCGYAANDEYVVGPDINGCQCFDRVNGNDRIGVYIHPMYPDFKNIVFEAGMTCGDGTPVQNNVCLGQAISDSCYIIDSHGVPGCNNCIVTVLERDPCYDVLSVNDVFIPEDTYQSFESILSSGTVDTSSHVIFKSNEIVLNPNFEVLQPAMFEALIDPDNCIDQFCPPIEDAPTFLQDLPDMTLLADDTCMAFLQLPFQVDYRFPDRLSVDLNSYGILNSSLMINTEETTDSISNYLLSGSIPIGQTYIYIDVEDSNCNLLTHVAFTVSVIDTLPPSIECPANQVVSLNQDCTAFVSNYRNQVLISNSCTSNIGLGDIVQSPAPATLLYGLSTDTISMTAMNYDGSIFTCSFDLEVVDLVAPNIICPANGTIMMPIDSNCQFLIPDLRDGLDNCDALIPTNTDGAGPRIYQVPQQGSVWVGVAELLIFAVDGSENKDTCSVALQRSCPSMENAPIFLQSLTDLSTVGDENCEVSISVPFSIQYCIPEYLSTRVDIAGPNSPLANVMIETTSVSGSSIAYTLSGTMPFGLHTITITVEDQQCNLFATDHFTVHVADPNLPTTFTCQWLVKSIDDSGTVAIQASEIATLEYDCYPSSTQIISSFSFDPTDNVTDFTCDDIGGQQMTIFTWDVIDVDNNGVLDTVFRQPCITIQTIIDPNGFCDE